MKNKKGRVGLIIIMISIIFASFFVGFFGAMYEIDWGLDQMEFNALTLVLLVCFLIVAVYIQIIIHEAGHLVCGLLTGYRFSSFRVGSFMVISNKDGLRFCRYSQAGTAGQCLLVPPDMKDGSIPYVLYNMGGTLFNLLAAVAFLLIWRCGDTGWMLSIFCIFQFLSGIILALMNGIPIAAANDGYNTLSLRKDKEALLGFWIQLKVIEYMAEGIRLKDMPEDWFWMPSESVLSNSITAAVGILTCNRAMDQMDFKKAADTAQDMLKHENGLIELHKHLLASELIFCELVGDRRKEVIDQLWSKEFLNFTKIMKSSLAVIRTQYTYELLLNQDHMKAGRLKERFEKSAEAYPYSGEMEGERELMTYVESL